ELGVLVPSELAGRANRREDGSDGDGSDVEVLHAILENVVGRFPLHRLCPIQIVMDDRRIGISPIRSQKRIKGLRNARQVRDETFWHLHGAKSGCLVCIWRPRYGV